MPGRRFVVQASGRLILLNAMVHGLDGLDAARYLDAVILGDDHLVEAGERRR